MIDISYYVVGTIVSVEVIYCLILLYMYSMQRNILYLPEKNILPPQHYDFDKMEDYVLEAIDGTQIGCWYQAPQENQPIILYFHGNAGHMGDRVEKMHAFVEAGFGICAPSYRGYGKSGGKPSEQGTYFDALAAVSFLKEKGYKDEQIVLYGESLGSGIAVEMAYQLPSLLLLVLEAPYTSTADRAIERYPFLPIYLLMKDQYDSLSKIPHIKVPLLLFHGVLDQTIPIAHGEKLFAAANGKKRAVFFDDVDHVNFDCNALTKEIATEVKKLH